jgi:hypothetical protein
MTAAAAPWYGPGRDRSGRATQGASRSGNFPQAEAFGCGAAASLGPRNGLGRGDCLANPNSHRTASNTLLHALNIAATLSSRGIISVSEKARMWLVFFCRARTRLRPISRRRCDRNRQEASSFHCVAFFNYDGHAPPAGARGGEDSSRVSHRSRFSEAAVSLNSSVIADGSAFPAVRERRAANIGYVLFAAA